MSAATKGAMPRTMVSSGRPATFWMTKRLMPTGGRIMPISQTVTSMTPNQIGSKPSATISLKTGPTVSSIIASSSISAPSTKYIAISRNITIHGEKPASFTARIRPSVRPVESMK